MTNIIGIDEAGRGCVIGPLVIAGVSVNRGMISWLISIGVRDSKRLTRERREELYDEIISSGIKYVVEKIPPSKIDVYVRRKVKYEKLNKLEAIYMAEVINRLDGDVAIIDACGSNINVFYDQVERRLRKKVRLIIAHKADSLYPAVSTASIIAKVERDREIEALKDKYGDFGSGYPSDRRTIEFIKSKVREGKLPPIIRKSWRTVRELKIRFS